MPRVEFEKYGVEIRTNEHNHANHEAHVHSYVHRENVATMFLDGVLRDGRLSSRDLKHTKKYVMDRNDGLQEKEIRKMIKEFDLVFVKDGSKGIIVDMPEGRDRFLMDVSDEKGTEIKDYAVSDVLAVWDKDAKAFTTLEASTRPLKKLATA